MRSMIRAGCLLLLLLTVAAEDRVAAWRRLTPDLAQALTPAARAELAPLPMTPLVEIVATVDPAAGTIAGTQRIWWPNGGVDPIADLAVRMPANAACFSDASLQLGEATWDGAPLGDGLTIADGTARHWTLPVGLEPGAAGTLQVAFTTTPSPSGGFHGLMCRDGGTWNLYHWHPELPLRRGHEWSTPEVTGVGDESQGPLAHLVVRLTVPTGMQVIAGGTVIARAVGADGDTVVIAAPFCRNLALVLAQEPLAVLEAEAAPGVMVRAWHGRGHANAAARVLRVARESLALYHATIGPYPYPELDVVESVQGDEVGGMESTGLVLISSGAYAACEHLPEDTPIEALPVWMLENVVAHEVAHQWWYGIVGNDAFAEPWLDESLTNWMGGWALERMRGEPARRAVLTINVMGVRMLADGATRPIDAALTGFSSMNDYGAVVYARGTLMYEALRRRLGDAAFLAFVRAWHDRHRFAVATAADWHAALAAALGVEEAATFSARWLRGDGLTARDLVDTLKPVPP